MRPALGIILSAFIALAGCTGESDTPVAGTPGDQPETQREIEPYEPAQTGPQPKAEAAVASDSASKEKESIYTGPAAPYIEKLGNSDSAVCDKAAEKLMDMGRAAVDALIVALKDRNGRIRANAAWVLGQIKDEKAVEPLIEAVRDGSSNVRSYAALALGKLGDKRAIPVLNAAVNDTDRDVRLTAQQALDKIEPERASRTAAAPSTGSGPEEVLRAFVSALVAKNPAGMYDCMSRGMRKQVEAELASIKSGSD